MPGGREWGVWLKKSISFVEVELGGETRSKVKAFTLVMSVGAARP